MKPFFITGLPRTRTAWLANLLTYGNSFCLHDGLMQGGLAGLVAMLRTLGQSRSFVGDADSGLTFHAAELVQLFPDARWLFIRRDPAKAEASYKKHFDGRDPYVSPGASVSALFERLVKQCDHARTVVPKFAEIEFDTLNQPEALRRAWAWCVPGEPFCEERSAMLEPLQMNVMPEKVRNNYAWTN